MIFIKEPNKIYAKVWKVDKKEKYTALRVSTGEKQEDGAWKNSNWNAKLVGKVKDMDVTKGDTLIIKSAKIENPYDKKNDKEWLCIVVFDAEVEGVKLPEWKDVQEVDDEILPF